MPGELSRESAPALTGAATAVAAEGARVGIVSCLKCGAALLLDPREDFNVVDRHRRWHNELESAWRASR